MEDQNQRESQSSSTSTEQFVDVVVQQKTPEPTTTPLAVPDPGRASEPTAEPVPAHEPAETPAVPDNTARHGQSSVAKSTPVDVAQPATPKQPSTVPLGPIIVAVIIFIVLAAVALVAFRQGF